MMDFDVAKTWHTLFAQQIELTAKGFVTNRNIPALVVDDSACKLGQWIHGPGRRMENHSSYRDLKNTHREFHKIAGAYLAAVLHAPDHQATRDIEARFKQASADVAAAIDVLRYETERAPEDSNLGIDLTRAPESKALDWDQTLELGIPILDEHHRQIVRLLAQLIQTPDAALRSEAVMDRFIELGTILKMHFSVEEGYMKSLGMPAPEYQAHYEKHSEILDQLVELEMAAFSGHNLCIRDIAQQLRQWAIGHILESDSQIKLYTRQQSQPLQRVEYPQNESSCH